MKGGRQLAIRSVAKNGGRKTEDGGLLGDQGNRISGCRIPADQEIRIN
jgi:hypothetical protein